MPAAVDPPTARAPRLAIDRALPWGSDSAGLIWGLHFVPGQSPRSVDSSAAETLLGSLRGGGASGEFLWLHFNLGHAGTTRWLERHADLSVAFFEALGSPVRSTRIERDGDSLVAVVNDVLFDFGFDPSNLSTLWASMDRCLVVTARSKPLRSADELHRRLLEGVSPASPIQLLELLLRTQADVLTDIVRRVTQRTDEIEDSLLSGRRRSGRADLGAMRRLLVRLQRLLAPEPTSLFRLLQHPPAWVGSDSVQELRAVNEEFLVVLSDMASLQDRIRLVQEEMAAAVGEATGRSLFMLTAATVLALPINILAGLFGMNVGGIPWAQSRAGFWIILAIVVTFTMAASWSLLRFSRK